MSPSSSAPPQQRQRLVMLFLALLVGAGVVLLNLQPKEPDFDLFLLVRSWSPGFCSDAECTTAPV